VGPDGGDAVRFKASGRSEFVIGVDRGAWVGSSEENAALRLAPF
jgi:hypothetical protein